MRSIGWLVLYLVASLFGELLLEITRVVNAEKELKPAAGAWFVILGVVFGVATAALVPDRVLPQGPFEGMSLLILPAVLAVSMSIFGSARGTARSHLASWYGGSALGLGLAVGRYMGLAFVAEIRSL